MYKLLKSELREPQGLFFYVENYLDISMTVTEKSSLIMHLSDHDHQSFEDLLNDAWDYLARMGHGSATFKEKTTSEKALERYWADFYDRQSKARIN